MTNQDNRSKAVADLRQKAEALARERAVQTPEDCEALSPEEIRKTLHELRVHQIELEMQNEALRTAHARIEAGRARYFELYDLAPVGYCTLSEQGLILEANLTAATLLGMACGDLIGQPISRCSMIAVKLFSQIRHTAVLRNGTASSRAPFPRGSTTSQSVITHRLNIPRRQPPSPK